MSGELGAFNTDGFFVAKKLLDEQSVQEVVRSLGKTFEAQLDDESRNQVNGDTFSAMQALHRQDLSRYRKVASALWRKLDVYQLTHDGRVTNFLRDKFGWRDIFVAGGQVVHIMAHELKIPGGYFGLVTHQDFPSVQGSLDGVVVWMPLVHVDRDNFPLEVIPGSHRLGLLPMVGDGQSAWEVSPDQYIEADFIPVEVDVGDVVFMSMFTLHRSSKNGKEGRCRLAVSTRFDNADEKTFVERGYPSAYERTVHREQYVPNFPTQEQIDVVFQGRREQLEDSA